MGDRESSPLTPRDRYIIRMLEYMQVLNMGRDGKRHQPLIRDYKDQLGKLYLYLTFDCNNHCWFCYANGGERSCREMSPEQFARIIRTGIDAGFGSIVLLGGEPLLYSGFSQLLEMMQKMDRKDSEFVLRSSLSFPLDDSRLRMICETFDEITTSIDGDEERHDSIRGPGRYACTMDNLVKGMAFGKAVFSINSVMSMEDFYTRQGEHVKALCDQLGIQKLTIQSPVPLGRAGSFSDAKRLYWKKTDDPLGLMCVGELFRTSCGLGHNLYVEPDGKAFPCYAWCGADQQLGDLSSETVPEMLERGQLLEIMNHGVDTNRKCRSCEVRYLCGGKCKLYVNDKTDIDSPDFECAEKKASILEEAERFCYILGRMRKEQDGEHKNENS